MTRTSPVKLSAFEVLGPIMVGPSSSHTAGALRLARIARALAPAQLSSVDFYLYNSFSETHKGHGTDRALLAGILGLSPDDTRVKDAFALADDAQLHYAIHECGSDESLHPNTVRIAMHAQDNTTTEITGESLGGGKVRISSVNGVEVLITGELPTVFVTHTDEPGVLARLCELFSDENINIATMRLFREERGGAAYTIFEVDEAAPEALIERLRVDTSVEFASALSVPGVLSIDFDQLDHELGSAQELLEQCAREQLSIGQYMRQREIDIQLVKQEQAGAAACTPAQTEAAEHTQKQAKKTARTEATKAVDAKMAQVLAVMREETRETIHAPQKSLGGFLDGQARAVANSTQVLSGFLMGEVLTRASAYAMAVLERSASMGVIVAAPTAGAAGVVPGALLSCAEALQLQGAPTEQRAAQGTVASQGAPTVQGTATAQGATTAQGSPLATDGNALTNALWNAAAIGAIISEYGSVSGAAGGCQAEVGSAAAMAASALVELCGGDAQYSLTAAALALSNVLGLVCDPVRGLVEYPCQLRNVLGVSVAVSSAQLALAGVVSPVPFDEMVEVMTAVGDALPTSLRETAQGGIAAAPSACNCCGACN